MVKSFALASMLGGMLTGLGTCSMDSAKPTVDQVQQIALQVCSAVPTVSSVAQLIAQNNPSLVTAEAIANAICNAIAKFNVSAEPGSGPKAFQVVVAGVPVYGSVAR